MSSIFDDFKPTALKEPKAGVFDDFVLSQPQQQQKTFTPQSPGRNNYAIGGMGGYSPAITKETMPQFDAVQAVRTAGLPEIASAVKEMVSPSTPYTERESEAMSSELYDRLSWWKTYVFSLGGRIGPKGLRDELLNQADQFSGFGPALMPSAGKSGSLALEWGVLYPQLFKAAGLSGKAIEKIPQVQKGTKALKEMGGVAKLIEKHPRAYSVMANLSKAFGKGATAGGTVATAEVIGKDMKPGEIIGHIGSQAAITGGVATAFQLASEIDTQLWVRSFRKELLKSHANRYDAKIAQIDAMPNTPAKRNATQSLGDRKIRELQAIDNIVAAAEAQLTGMKQGKIYKEGQEVVENPFAAAERISKYGIEKVRVVPKGPKGLKKGLGERKPFIDMPTTRAGEMVETAKEVGQAIRHPVKTIQKAGVSTTPPAYKPVSKAPIVPPPVTDTAKPQPPLLGKQGSEISKDLPVVEETKPISQESKAQAGEGGVELKPEEMSFVDESLGSHHGQRDGRYIARDKDGNYLGRIDYVEFDDEISISMIEVEPEHRRKGVATALYNKLKEEYSDMKVVPFGDFATKEGQAWIESLEESTPAPPSQEAQPATQTAGKKKAWEMIKKHNDRRPKDINWQRWSGSVDNIIDTAVRNYKSEDALGKGEGKSRLERINDARIAREKKAEERALGSRYIVFKHPDVSNRKWTITPSAKTKGKWQLTKFRDDKPISDIQFATKEEAIKEAIVHNFQVDTTELEDLSFADLRKRAKAAGIKTNVSKAKLIESLKTPPPLETKEQEQPRKIAKVDIDKEVTRYEEANQDFVVNADRAKKQLSGYDPRDIANERKYFGDAAEISGKVYDRWLETRKGKGNNTVLFLAGGTGSGKSTVAEGITSNQQQSITVDSTLSSKEYAIEQIDKAIKAGYQPEIRYVYRDPVDAWENGIWKRYEQGGHYVPADIFLNTHVKSKQNVIELAEKYGEKVSIRLYENRTGEKVKEISLDKLKEKSYNLEEIKEQINDISKQKLTEHPHLKENLDVFTTAKRTGQTDDRGTKRRERKTPGTAEGEGPLQASVGASMSPQLDAALQRAAGKTGRTTYVSKKSGKWMLSSKPPKHGDYYEISAGDSKYVKAKTTYSLEKDAIAAARYIARNTKQPLYIWQTKSGFKLSAEKPKHEHVKINPKGPGLTRAERAILSRQQIAEAEIAQEEGRKVGFKAGSAEVLKENLEKKQAGIQAKADEGFPQADELKSKKERLTKIQQELNTDSKPKETELKEGEEPQADIESPMGGFVGGRPASAKVSAIVNESMKTGSSKADAFLRRTKGFVAAGRPGLLRRVASNIMQTFREFHYLPDLPKTADFANVREAFRHTEEISRLGTDYATEKMKWAIKPIEGIRRETRKRMQALEMKLIADDLAEDIEKGVDLPPKITDADVVAMQKRADELYNKYPSVRNAYDRLREVTTEIGDMLVEEGMLKKEQAREFYFPHKVVKYLRNEDGFFGIPSRKPADYKKGYLKQRKGGYDYSTDIMERLVEHWAQVRRDVEYRRFLEKTLKQEQQDYFRKEYPEWQEFTKTEDGKRMRNLVPEGYKEVTVLPGRYYYSTHGVTEDMAKALIEQDLDSIEEILDEETAGKVRKVLAVGKKRSYIVREPIARQIHNMPTMAISRNPAYLAVKGFNSFVKGQILFNPLYTLPFHLTNFVGDAHKVAVALPGALKGKYLANYWKEIINAHNGKKSKRFDLAQKYGVIGSGWIGVDIPQLKSIIPEIEKAEITGASKYAMNKAKRLWNLVKRAGAGREDWLRYALFDRLMDLQEAGKDITKYSIKDSQTLKGITGPDVLAAKVARDIAGDYAAIGRTGRILSDLVVPFYRWMHLNLPWWPRMMKEYAKKGQAGRLAYALMAAAAPYILSTIWNYSDDDRRKYEKKLPYYKRWSFHIIGLRGEKMYYIPLPLDDVSNFIGAPETILDFQRYQRGMIDIPELLKRIAINSTYEPGMSVVNAVGGAAGVTRDMIGLQTYPDIKPWLETRWGRKSLNMAGDIFGSPAQLGKAIQYEGVEYDSQTGEIKLGPKTTDLLNRSWMGIRPYTIDEGRTRKMLGKSIYKRTNLIEGQIAGQPHKGKDRRVDSLRIQLEGEK